MPLKISPTTVNETVAPIFNLYVQLLEAWNAQDAHAFAAGFADNGSVIGFDGSLMNGLSEIEMTLSGIFGHHKTAEYVALVREIRFLSPQSALLRAVVGMIPPGKSELNPECNAVQTLVAVLQDDKWQIALFQNTPARFDGRPELAKSLTEELSQLL